MTESVPASVDIPAADPLRRVVARRTFLVGAVGGGAALLAACGAGSSSSTPTSTSATAAPATTSEGTAGTTAAVVAAAKSFLGTLTDDQRAGISFPYPTGETKATPADFSGRVGEKFGDSVWSNYPISDVIRPGLKMGDLTEPQHTAALAFLSAALNPAGYQKFADITNADQVLADSGTNYAAGTANYVMGVFGTPLETERWMWQLGGHHLGITTTIQGASMSMAPMLTGCQPSSYTVGGQTIRPLAAETDKAFALINALDATQRQQAILPTAVTDLVLGPGHDGETLAPEGLQAATMNADQQAMLLDLVGEWVRFAPEPVATTKMDDIKSHLADTYFAWSGETTAGSSIYFRVTGPTVHVEFANQGAMGGGPGPTGGAVATGTPEGTGGGPPADTGVQAGGVNHIHTVYRDGSYGREF
jgi:Protein of unknown function (DUF3500)